MRQLWVCLFALFAALKLDAVETLELEPTMLISGSQAILDRPEGLDFSPTGDLLAVANSHANSITFYKRIGDMGAQYENEPASVIQDDLHLRFVHDVRFSPCGKFLAAVSRERHLTVVYKRNADDPSLFEPEPHSIIEGLSSKLDNPTCTCFSTMLNFLAVCNRWSSGVTLHKKLANGHYENAPFSDITEEQFLAYDLGAPHSIALSQDSKVMAIAHKRFFKKRSAKGRSAIAIFEMDEQSGARIKLPPLQILYLDDMPLHSLTFHPTGQYLIASNEETGVLFLEKKDQQFVLSFEIPIKTKAVMGCKGVAFSPAGDCMAISTEQDQVLLYHLNDL